MKLSLIKVILGGLLSITIFLIATIIGLHLIISRPIFTTLTKEPFARDVAASVFAANVITAPSLPKCGLHLCFTAAEISHLQDVRLIYVDLVKTSLITATALFLAIISFKVDRTFLKTLVKNIALYLFLTLIMSAAIAAMFWDRFFTFFHIVAFPQGNWAFPADSLLITLYPVEFWQQAATYLLITNLVIYSLIFLLVRYPLISWLWKSTFSRGW